MAWCTVCKPFGRTSCVRARRLKDLPRRAVPPLSRLALLETDLLSPPPRVPPPPPLCKVPPSSPPPKSPPRPPPLFEASPPKNRACVSELSLAVGFCCCCLSFVWLDLHCLLVALGCVASCARCSALGVCCRLRPLCPNARTNLGALPPRARRLGRRRVPKASRVACASAQEASLAPPCC